MLESLSASLSEKEREEDTLTISAYSSFLTIRIHILLTHTGDEDSC